MSADVGDVQGKVLVNACCTERFQVITASGLKPVCGVTTARLQGAGVVPLKAVSPFPQAKPRLLTGLGLRVTTAVPVNRPVHLLLLKARVVPKRLLPG